MKAIRWILSFPITVVLSVVAWMLLSEALSGVDLTYGGGFWRSVIGLCPIAITAAVPTSLFVVVGVAIAPSQGRKVCFVFFGLSLLFSGGGIELLRFPEIDQGFWFAAASGIVVGALFGLAFAHRLQSRSKT